MIRKNWNMVVENIRKKRFDIFYKAFLYMIFRFKNHEGFEVMDEEWDNLIVLDSCRYDAFKEVNHIPGKLEKKTSQGTTTIQWLNQNFTEYYDDIAYLSTVNFVHPEKPSEANYQTKPFNAQEHFSVIENITDGDGIEKGKHLDAEQTTKKALEFSQKHPEKRKIIHYTPPHLPFITSKYVKQHNYDTYEQYLREGYTWKQLKKEYKETTKKTLQEVEKLTQQLEGKTIITADHGEAHNEYYIKNHPHSIYIKPLTEIPWLEVEK